jgi:hypothetical protein
MPQIAVTFPSLFYLPDWLLVTVPFSQGLALSMIFHITVAAVGFYLLARSLCYKSAEALSGALVFSLSGYMFCLSSNVSLIAGLAWLPLSLWALRELETQRRGVRFWHVMRATACILLLLLSGRPEIVGPALVSIVAYCLIAAVRRKRDWVKLWDISFTRQFRAIFLAGTFSFYQ